MTQQTPQRNPFMLMINPEVVLAAMEIRTARSAQPPPLPTARPRVTGRSRHLGDTLDDDEDEVELPPEA